MIGWWILQHMQGGPVEAPGGWWLVVVMACISGVAGLYAAREQAKAQ